MGKDLSCATLALTSCVCYAQSKEDDDRLTPVQVAEDIEVFRREVSCSGRVIHVKGTHRGRDLSEGVERRAARPCRLRTGDLPSRCTGGQRSQRMPPTSCAREAPIQFVAIDGNYYVMGIEARNAALLGRVAAVPGRAIHQEGRRVRHAGARWCSSPSENSPSRRCFRTPARLYAMGYSATKNGVMYRSTGLLSAPRSSSEARW